jgi:hypothetical protein
VRCALISRVCLRATRGSVTPPSRVTTTLPRGEKADLHITLNKGILLTNVAPKPVNSRGNLGLDRIDLTCVLARMVKVFSFLSFSYNFVI